MVHGRMTESDKMVIFLSKKINFSSLFLRFALVLAGQEKIIRAFSEIMKNMSRMKSCVRPAMCKPYGKQSEALQKSTSKLTQSSNHRLLILLLLAVIDTIQLVQSLRSFLPPPHIAVSSWKNEDKHR